MFFFGQRAKAVQKQTFSGVSVSTFHYRYNSYGSILGILFLRSIFSEESSESKGYWRESNVDKYDPIFLKENTFYKTNFY